MRITSGIYFEAAKEHLQTALDLHEEGHYVMSHFVSGVAVECLFRAYMIEKDPVFDARHELILLYKSCGFYNVMPIKGRERFESALQVVHSRWLNNFRFFSEATLKVYLKKGPYCRKKIKGNKLKESSRMIVASASLIVTLGVERWKHLKKG